MSYAIRAADTAELEEIGRLRYRIYVEEMARTQRHADHRARTVLEPLDATGTVLLARDRGELVGTVRWNRGLPGEYAAFFCPGGELDADDRRVSVSSKLMVLERYRTTTLAVRLAQAAYDIAALGHGALLNFIDCNDHLVAFFSGLGFVELGTALHPEYGNVHRMVLCLPDADRLRAARSPFAELAARRYDTADLERARELLAKLQSAVAA